MRFKDISDWLAWQESLHDKVIEMGLGRMAQVYQPLLNNKFSPYTVLVGGTNGKGSTVAYLSAIYQQAGYRVGTYTSPHLLRYTERIVINKQEISEEELCRAFQAVEDARGDSALTQFEFGTLAALWWFEKQMVDVAILEVGLGGRLDAVNIVDADAAAIVSVGLDHQDRLGHDIAMIGWEKAGIFRAHRPAICAARQAPHTIAEVAKEKHADFYQAGRDYAFSESETGWWWAHDDLCYEHLPWPGIAGVEQMSNAACAIQLVTVSQQKLPVLLPAIEAGIAQARLPGRFDCVLAEVETIFDVAHNADSAQVLAATLAQRPHEGRTWAVFGALSEKDLAAVLLPMMDLIDEWIVTEPRTSRALPVAIIAQWFGENAPNQSWRKVSSVSAAMQRAYVLASPGDRLVVFGSFFTVAEAYPKGV